MSELMRNERATDCAYAPEPGERRCRRKGMSEDSAPELETEPISSWLNSAIQFTLPSSTLNDEDEAKVASASSAQNLGLVSQCPRPCSCPYGMHSRGELVVHARAEDELIVQSTENGGLNIIEVSNNHAISTPQDFGEQ